MRFTATRYAEMSSRHGWSAERIQPRWRARSVGTRAAVASSYHGTLLLLTTGEAVEVEGGLEEVAKRLENAARSGSGTLAWFDELAGNERLGVNPGHVVSVRRKRS